MMEELTYPQTITIVGIIFGMGFIIWASSKLTTTKIVQKKGYQN